MITVFTVNKDIPKSRFKRTLNKLRNNRIESNKLSIDGICINHIKFKQTTKNIPWKKIKKNLNNNTQNLLCNNDIRLPAEYGFFRYHSMFFMRRLAENASLVSLEKANVDPNKIKISLYDPRCVHFDMAELLLPYCSELKVITNNIKFYETEALRLNSEYGTPIFISDVVYNIYPSNVIVAPDKIKKKIKTSNTTIIFTGEKPVVPLDGIVYDSYKVNLPTRFKSLECLDLDNEYLLSALYENENIHQLGSMVPNYCFCKNKLVSLNKVSENIVRLSEGF